MFTEQEMQEIVSGAKELATQKMYTQMVDAIDYGVKQAVAETIRKQITEQCEAEIRTIAEEEWDKAVPKIREIIAGSFITIANDLAKAMTEQAVKNLDGYNRKDIIKKLFDIY